MVSAAEPSRADGAGRARQGVGNARARFTAAAGLLDRPLTSYYLVLGITTLLLALGLVMVLSTSSITGLIAGGSPWSGFQKQLLGVALGLPCIWFAARSSPTLFRAAAYPLIGLSILGLMLTLIPHVGVSSGGASRWIQVGPLTLQPSELAKLAFVIWGADLLTRKKKLGQLADWRQLLIPLMPGAGFICLLVMLGDDLGTTFMMLVILLALLWVIGTPARLMLAMLAMIGLVLLILIVVAPYRWGRLVGFLCPAGDPVGK